MKLSREETSTALVSGYRDRILRIGASTFDVPILLRPGREPEQWHADHPDTLTIDDFALALSDEPELIVMGTGPQHRFPDVRVSTAIMQRGVGFEVMATEAACRTYNVLASESRHVVAALFV